MSLSEKTRQLLANILALGQSLLDEDDGEEASPQTFAPTPTPPSFQPGGPVAVTVGGPNPNLPSAGDVPKMSRKDIDSLIERERLTNIDHRVEIPLKTVRQSLIDHINRVNGPGGGVPASAAPSVPFVQPTPMAPPSVAPVAPTPALNFQPQVAPQPAPVAAPSPIPMAAPVPMPAPVTAPPAPMPAPVVAAPAPVAPAPVVAPVIPQVNEVVAKVAAFKSWVAQQMSDQGGQVVNFWTQGQLQHARELQTFFWDGTNGALAVAPQTADGQAAQGLVKQYVTKLGCQGECMNCPHGPAQPIYCKGIFDSEPPFNYKEAVEKNHLFLVIPPANMADLYNAANGPSSLRFEPQVS